MNQASTLHDDSNVYLITPDLNLITCLAVLATMITTFVVFSNVTIVVAMLVSRHTGASHNDHSITKLLMASMACVDVLIGTVHMPINVLQLIYNGKWILGAKLCNIFTAISNVLCGANNCHILCIAVDKYLAVCKPLVYRILTKRIGHVMVILSWSLPSTMFLLPLVTDWFGTRIEEMANDADDHMTSCSPISNKYILLVFYILCFYLPIITSYVLYALTFSEIWKFNTRKYRNAENNVKWDVSNKGGQVSNMYEGQSVSCTSSQSSNFRRFPASITIKQLTRGFSSKMPGKKEFSGRISRNIKAIRTLGTIIVCFSVCWTPVWISAGLYVYMEFTLPFRYIFLTGWFACINSAINPVLCSFFKPIRKALRYLLCYVTRN